ncbi:ubiquitin carboxyl-terminal hydrolase [Parachaetomium inaequale]|uniref:ubiquitinyl hydrolase 1 n=1 Tax=Parachaetomium inaequale TaxID=2588326 RepID=A0AAN6SW66_9PEZI|nr:ubiquitin carboxyl-terminal hydrolase [Parachaetomium inaequale]
MHPVHPMPDPASQEPDNNDHPSWFQRCRKNISDFIERIDDGVSKTPAGRLFRLKGSGHGITTFTTMAYVIAVNAFILAESGYGCPCEKPYDLQGNCANMAEWTECYNDVKLDLVTATTAVAGFSSILFGLLTNLPVALGPGMGLNAYFTYQVVGVKGMGSVNYRVALTAVFIEGWIFMFLALTGLRHWLVKIIPGTIKIASGVGIGLFLTLIGMSYTSGLGMITGGTSTPLTIGGCPVEHLNEAGECTSGIMTNPKTWVGIICGGLLTTFLMAFRVKGAIIIGIAIVSVLSWPRHTPLTYFPDTPDGDQRFSYFSKVVSFHPIRHTLAQQQWDLTGESGSRFAIALFTFLYVDIIDCTATLYSMARFCSRARKDKADFPRSTMAFCVDAFCISMGALLGLSPVTAFIESSAGIAEGGRTGLTAMFTGLCFLISLFFAPLFASIPPWATGSTLILVGCMMIRQVTKINWAYIGDAIPSFITLAFIPFSYSCAYGLLAGLFAYIVINGAIYTVVRLSGHTIVPENYELKEYWSWRPPGEKPWFARAVLRAIYWARYQRDREASFSLNSRDETLSAEHYRPDTTSKAEDGVFTYLLDNLGVKDVQFEELLSLDPDALAQLYPVYGVIFLFKYPTDTPYHAGDKPLDGTFDEDASERLFFAAQTIQNACGTQALLSVLLNKTPDDSSPASATADTNDETINIGPTLTSFREFTMALPPEYRGEALSNSELIRDVHNSFAKSSPFVDETQRNPADSEAEDAFHFIAYTAVDGTLYELDGLQRAPISHGPCATRDEFPARVMAVLQRRVARYDAAEIRFNLLAMVRDRRIRAREVGDAEMLAREERKRRDWQFENALRRHNFVGFAGEVLKGVVAAKLGEGGGAYEKWVDQGKQKMLRRIEERKKGAGGGGGGGGGDVEMAG